VAPEPGTVSRTVSRSPSDASIQSLRPLKTTVKKKANKIKNSLMSTEKAAVAAMLSLKSSSDDSDAESTEEHQPVQSVAV